MKKIFIYCNKALIYLTLASVIAMVIMLIANEKNLSLNQKIDM